MIKFKTTSPEMTEKFGYELAKSLCGGDVIALTGDLGAGKTCLTRGIAQGLGSSSYVSSPTFTIVNEYDGGRLMLFHFDTYRLSGPDDFLMSGLDEYFYREGVCVIEWSDIIEELEPIYLNLDSDFTYSAYANDIAWNLALAYIKDDQIEKAIPILEKLETDNPDMPIAVKAQKILKEIK